MDAVKRQSWYGYDGIFHALPVLLSHAAIAGEYRDQHNQQSALAIQNALHSTNINRVIDTLIVIVIQGDHYPQSFDAAPSLQSR